ncbi:MAG: fibronectin type III domain-containing protein [Methanosarcinales archaeon]|nr:fibronectin type III domain-containing protein [Methanosarcinales archaeon]
MISNKHNLSAVLLLGILLFSLTISSGGVQFSANVLPSGILDNTATADIPVSGTVTGNYTHTHTSDNTYESIQEDAITTGKPDGRISYLEHKWTIDVGSAKKANVTFYLEANHTQNGENDDFVFAYSTDDTTYHDMLTVTNTSDDGTYQTFKMPQTTGGTVYIRVQDTDRTTGFTVKDTIYIDHMFIHSIYDIEPPAVVTGVMVTQVSESKLNISWTANTEADLDHYNVYRGMNANFIPDAGSMVASPTADYYSDTGLTADTTYYYRVTAVDNSDNEGQPSEVASGTTLPDTEGPAALDVLASPNPTNGVGIVTLTANIDDSASGNSTVTAVEYFINTTGSNGSGVNMNASDDVFDSPFEAVSAEINVSDWVYANYTLYIHGRDSAGWGEVVPVVLEVTELPANTSHVHSIDISLGTKTAGKNIFTYGIAQVTIVDAAGAAVEGASVEGHWSNATTDADTGITDASGQVTLESDEVKNALGGTTFNFTVDDVVLAGWTYDPAANVETSDNITTGSSSGSSAGTSLFEGFFDYLFGLLGR